VRIVADPNMIRTDTPQAFTITYTNPLGVGDKFGLCYQRDASFRVIQKIDIATSEAMRPDSIDCYTTQFHDPCKSDVTLCTETVGIKLVFIASGVLQLPWDGSDWSGEKFVAFFQNRPTRVSRLLM
jgi:hypothetical protein